MCRRNLAWGPDGVEGGAHWAVRALLGSPLPANRGPFSEMPNIKQQKRRVQTAARERLENLRYRSAAKTLFKRLETSVAEGDADQTAADQRELVRLLDRAAARGAIHPNRAARKKSQAARLAAGETTAS